MPTDLMLETVAKIGDVIGLEDRGTVPSSSRHHRVFEHPTLMIRVKISESARKKESELSLDITPVEGYVHGPHKESILALIEIVMRTFKEAVANTSRESAIYARGRQTTAKGVYNNLYSRR